MDARACPHCGSHAAAAKTPTGNPRSERKPTEKHLDVLIEQYRDIYRDATQTAVDAVVKLLRDTGPMDVKIREARTAYLDALMPILDAMMPLIREAAILGAARRWDPRTKKDELEVMVDAIVAQVRDRRLAWLTKMADDFIEKVLIPVLQPAIDAGAGEPMEEAPKPSRGRVSAPPASLIVPSWAAKISPGLFTVGDPKLVYEFDQETLDELTEKGYQFGEVRVVEATTHDIWNGDDVAYIEASRQDGVRTFTWRTSNDALVCPICDPLEGTEYTPAEAELASRDRAEETHCGCRCFFEAVEP